MKSIFITSFSLVASLSLANVPSAEARPAAHRPHAVTMWWVIFNNPEACLANPRGAEKCGSVDVFGAAYLQSIADGNPDPSLIDPNLAAKVSVIYATGGVTDRDNARVRLTASIYRTQSHLYLAGPQSIDPLGLGTAFMSRDAEVHLVVRDHGRTGRAGMLLQTTNFLEPYCSDPLLRYEGGRNICQDIQFAVFAPGESGEDIVRSAVDAMPLLGASAHLFRQGDALQAVLETRIPDRRR